MMDWIAFVGYIAATLVATTFYVRTMIPMRCFALASNVCFIVYAYLSSPQLYPVLLLHLYLLPLNGFRLRDLIKSEQVKI